MTTLTPTDAELNDWEFCCSALEETSRSFSQPIQFLPPELRKGLTVGYLLCRVVDTVEDCVGLSETERDDNYSLFQRILRGEAQADELIARMEAVELPAHEARLMNGFARLMRVFRDQRHSFIVSTIRWVSEMTDGMRLYSRRAEGREFNAAMSLPDLQRYCYFVAGTVGHLITDLFVDYMQRPDLEGALRVNAESFGLGLQLVNIVKDVTDDHERDVCYIPRSVCQSQGFEPESILESANQKAALAAVADVIEVAEKQLKSALDYTLQIPAAHHTLRLFCLLPLWMARETLTLCHSNLDVLTPGKKVKITRADVGRIIADCGRLCRDDAGLRAAYGEMVTAAAHRDSLAQGESVSGESEIASEVAPAGRPKVAKVSNLVAQLS